MNVQRSAEDYFKEAGSLLTQGKLQEASQHLEAGLRIDPTRRWAWMNLGVALKELGDYNASERCLLKAKALDQNDGNAWFNLGTLYLRHLGRYEDAYRCLQEAIRCNPDDEDAVSFTAEALDKLGRGGEAGQLLDKAIEEHPDWKNALRNREALAVSFRQFLVRIVQQEYVEVVRVIRPEDPTSLFQFNYGAPYVISVNRRVPGSSAVKEFIVQRLAEMQFLDKVIFEKFDASVGELFLVEIGSKVPLEIAQLIIQTCFVRCDLPMTLSVEQEDKNFGYTQRAYIGSIVNTRKVPVSEEDVNALLNPRLTHENFIDIIMRL